MRSHGALWLALLVLESFYICRATDNAKKNRRLGMRKGKPISVLQRPTESRNAPAPIQSPALMNACSAAGFTATSNVTTALNFQEPPARVLATAPRLVPAFSFRGAGLVECLLRDVAGTGAFLAPRMKRDADLSITTAMLPLPSVLDRGLYAVRCVRLDNGLETARVADNWDFRWPKPNQGPEFVGEALHSATPEAGSGADEPQGGQQPSYHKNCTRVASLLAMRDHEALWGAFFGTGDGGSPIPAHGCPAGLVVEANWANDSYGPGATVARNGPAAVLRTLHMPPADDGGDDEGRTGDDGGGGGGGGGGGVGRREASPWGAPAPEVVPMLPRCTEGSFPGRWLPTDLARPLVTNGANIPPSRPKYWVPFGCRPTHWDIHALRSVAEGGGDTGSPCRGRRSGRGHASAAAGAVARGVVSGSGGVGGGGNSESGGCALGNPSNGSGSSVSGGSGERLQCNLASLRHVVFTGSSTTSALFSAFRAHVLLEDEARAARNKTADHAAEAAGRTLWDVRVDLGAGFAARFAMEGQLMPLAMGVDPVAVKLARRLQVFKLLNGTNTSLSAASTAGKAAAVAGVSALVLHVGLHELCGAYGPAWALKGHSPCASRRELAETYRDYGEALRDAGFTGKAVFRSLMGSFPDGPNGVPFRFKGFANCDDGVEPRRVGKSPNTCGAIAWAASHAVHHNGDAAGAWAAHEVDVVDAYSPVHGSPTSAAAFRDSLHPAPDSDEALAVNQLLLNWLCASGSADAERGRMARDWPAEASPVDEALRGGQPRSNHR